MTLRALALTAWLTLLGLPAYASGVRCNPDLVEIGDSVAELLQLCGQPLTRAGVDPQDVSGPTTAIEQWTYSVGPGTLVRVVTVANGHILAVEDGDPPPASQEPE
ncbi:MAG TPA: DUF2845 domain-containing protein [Myxococcota bacterium]|nr:DUF2845 domain-containing protein [Myxococcota bacterium]